MLVDVLVALLGLQPARFVATAPPNRGEKFAAFPFARHAELDLTIEGMTHHGEGVARVRLPDNTDTSNSGWVVFVPYVLPGERVRARITRNAKGHSRADLLEVLTPSPDREAASTVLCEVASTAASNDASCSASRS